MKNGAAVLSNLCLAFSGNLIVYFFVALFMVIEGELFLLVAGSLVHFGILNFWPLTMAAIIGTWLSDLLWYELGRRYGEKIIKRWGKWFFLTPVRFLKIEEMIRERGEWLILVSKFSYGLNHAFMLAAGTVKFDFKKFLKYQFSVSVLWVLAFILLGRFFASSLATIEKDIKFVGLAMLGIVLIFWAGEKFFIRKFFKKIASNGSAL
jgi:membrane protein DedA with SNARE-associated domain